jgi:hypothetical protein
LFHRSALLFFLQYVVTGICRLLPYRTIPLQKPIQQTTKPQQVNKDNIISLIDENNHIIIIIITKMKIFTTLFMILFISVVCSNIFVAGMDAKATCIPNNSSCTLINPSDWCCSGFCDCAIDYLFKCECANSGIVHLPPVSEKQKLEKPTP